MNIEALLLLAQAAANPFTPGTVTEHFNVPNIWPCGPQISECTSLMYVIEFHKDYCVAPVDPHVVNDGREIAVAITEEGERGRSGYSWTMKTTEPFVGPTDFTITYQAISECIGVS